MLSKLTETGEAGTADPGAAYAIAYRAKEITSNESLKEEAQLRLRELSLKLSTDCIHSAQKLCEDHPDTSTLLHLLLDSQSDVNHL